MANSCGLDDSQGLPGKSNLDKFILCIFPRNPCIAWALHAIY